MTQPSRLTYWRIVLGIIPPLAFLSMWQAWLLAEKLGIAPLTSKSWLAGLGILLLIGALSLVLLAVTWSSRAEILLDRLETGSQVKGSLRWIGLSLLIVSLTGYSLLVFHTYYTDLLRAQQWICAFI